MMPPVSFPVRPGSGPAKPAEAANEFRTTATASIQRMGEGSCEMLDFAILSAIAMHISSAGADTFDDLGAAVVFPPYRLDRIPALANFRACARRGHLAPPAPRPRAATR